MEEKEFRNRIYWLTFLFSILVVWVHSFNAELFLGNGEEAARVLALENIAGDGLGQIAVPGFFVLSGYLFYRNFSWGKLLPKWRSRVKSVVIPYALWNFLYYIGYVVSTRLPGAAGLVGKEPVPFGLRELFMAVCHYAYNPVFWYMQQLILLILLAPVLFWVLKSSLRGSLLFLFLLWFLWGSRILPILNADALLYYGTGAFTALHRDSWGSFAEKKPDAASAGKQAALLGALCLGVYLMGREGGILNCRSLYIVLLRLFGVAWAGLLIKLAPLPEAKEWMKHNFFLYAIHFAWVRLINKAAARLLPLTAATAFGIFLVMPVLILLISTCLVKVMERFCPRVYEVLAGGR